jgi:glycosyltransferase involved in cell wall biosynthesis
VKIVLLAPFGLRPKGTVLARMVPLAAALTARGNQVVIIAPPYTNPADAGTVELVQGVPVHNIRLGPFSGPLTAPFLAWRLFRSALAQQPDLVHLFKPKGYGGLAAMLQLCCTRLGLAMPPLFVDSDDLEGKGGMNELHDYSRAEKVLFHVQEQWLPRRARGVTVASRALEAMLGSSGVPAVHLLYLPNCVQDRQPGNGVAVRRQLGIAADAPVLLLYTRFFEFDQELLHTTLAAIHGRVPGLRILVVGQGRHGEEELLRQAARDRGFVPALVMAGWVEPVHVPDYLAAGTVALYPFKDTPLNRAKCPAKLTELLLAGLPVVADRVGQIPEYLAPQLRGLLCAPGDHAAMADRCAELLLDRERCRELGALGRSYILDTYSWSRYADLLLEFYRVRLGSGIPGRVP